MKDLIFRNICSDKYSLQNYLSGEHVSIDSIKDNLFIMERELDYNKPDHYFKLRRQKVFDEIVSLKSLILSSFKELDKEFLSFDGKQINVVSGKFELWQDLITKTPPLPIIAFNLNNHLNIKGLSPNEVSTFTLIEKIKSVIGSSTLPYPKHLLLESLVKRYNLSDLHIHLNGSTEVAYVWLSALKTPKLFYNKFQKSFSDKKVKEQFDQVEYGLTPRKIYTSLVIASNIREQLCRSMYPPLNTKTKSTLKNVKLYKLQNDEDRMFTKHPLSYLSNYKGNCHDIYLECLFFMKAFNYIKKKKSSHFASFFHLYLLLYGFFNKLITHQKEQNGFDQFQKITKNELRALIEENYESRFSQLCGENNASSISLIEGRFAPKKSVSENLSLLNSIFKGFSSYNNINNFDIFSTKSKEINSKNRPKLKLVAHFIKYQDNILKNTSLLILKVRHHQLRNDLIIKAKALTTAMSHSNFIKKNLVGIDAAANELEAPPEVFAPCYRYCRNKGINNFTYHVGEDFIHIISGLRAIYEAITFLDLKEGDRIGHATALGLCPELWLKRIGDEIVISQGEWLDNLVFIYFLLAGSNNSNLFPMELIRLEIEKYFTNIYSYDSEKCNISILIKAWQLRFLDPFASFYPSEKEDKLYKEERIEWILAEKYKNKYPGAYNLFKQYHSPKYLKKYNEKIFLDLKNLFGSSTVSVIKEIQNLVSHEIHEKEVVIESMLTSNLRISVYNSYKEHHLWRWLGISEDKYDTNLPVCIGSDDPGIFSTNIKNEYTHIYEQLVFQQKKSHQEAADIIESLIKNGEAFAFE